MALAPTLINTVADAGIRKNCARWVVRVVRDLQKWFNPIWFHLLNATRPVRHKIGPSHKERI